MYFVFFSLSKAMFVPCCSSLFLNDHYILEVSTISHQHTESIYLNIAIPCFCETIHCVRWWRWLQPSSLNKRTNNIQTKKIVHWVVALAEVHWKNSTQLLFIILLYCVKSQALFVIVLHFVGHAIVRLNRFHLCVYVCSLYAFIRYTSLVAIFSALILFLLSSSMLCCRYYQHFIDAKSFSC